MITLGLTGSLGTGKTTALGYFKKLGASVLDSDDIVHGLYKDKALLHKIHRYSKSLGLLFLAYKNKNARRVIAKKVFSSKKHVDKINSLIHPLVKSRIMNFLKENKKPVVVVEVPLLFEAHFQALFDAVVVVAASYKTSKKRIAKEGRLGANDFKERMRWQWPLEKKIAHSDFIIDNSGTREETFQQARNLIEILKNMEE